MTQETFLRAWKALPGWEPRAKFSTMEHLPERTDPAMTPAELLDQSQRVRAVEDAISHLPERQAAALTLCALQGHSQAEAADIMDVSVEALESLLARARRTLRASLLERAAS